MKVMVKVREKPDLCHLTGNVLIHIDDFLSDFNYMAPLNLGAYFDTNMDMTTHIKQLIRASFYQLRRIHAIRRLRPTSTAI